jgi:hypothetical protein
MNDAARGLQDAAGRLADCAQSRPRDYRRAETAFSKALEAFQDAAAGTAGVRRSLRLQGR